MGGSDVQYNYPAQPSYGEGMADALKAQVELLTGKGEFSGIAPEGLKGLLPLEEDIRRETAQTDTDILRQTLLGTTTGGGEQEVTYDDQGRVIRGYKEAPSYEVRHQLTGKIGGFGDRVDVTNLKLDSDARTGEIPQALQLRIELVDPDGNVVSYADENVAHKFGNDNIELFTLPIGDSRRDGYIKNLKTNVQKGIKAGTGYNATVEEFFESIPDDVPAEVTDALTTNWETRESLSSEGDAVISAISFPQGEGSPIYLTDENGEIIQDPEKAGMTETRFIPEQRAEDGMIDLLGDKRLTADGRKPGFDEDGNFLGLSALAEDVKQGNLSRQREADLADVENLKDRYKSVMDEFKPAAAGGIADAQSLLTEQKEALTGAGAISVPSEGTYTERDRSGVKVKDVKFGDTPTLDAQTSYDELTGIVGPKLERDTGYTARADATGGQFGGEEADALRTALLGQATSALDGGLTDRERRAIEQASRARQTATGRIFDPSATIEEAQAVIEEDRNRQMQNRAFAQGVLGQEAGLQQSDLGRGLQAQLANQQAVNQALQFGTQAGLAQEEAQARMGLQGDLANLQAEQRRRESGLQAGLTQDFQQAGLEQQKALTEAEIGQQSALFGAESALRKQLADDQAKLQAAQFDVGAEMDAERLNEQLKQAGTLGYVDAVGRLAALEDQYMLDPFVALLGRGGGGSLQAGQGVLGQANYGLASSPQYLNPEGGLGYIQNQATNAANMYAAQISADATRDAGRSAGLGNLGGGLLGMLNFSF